MILQDKMIIGAGGGGGSKSQRTPVEAPDSLESYAILNAIDLIGEGPIGGLVDGLKSVYFNKTPVQNASGTFNFNGVTVETRNGEVNQLPLANQTGVESPHAVGLQVKYGSPISFTITNPNANSASVIVYVPSLLTNSTSTGDVSGASVSYTIDVSPDNGTTFVNVVTDTISGKTTSKYQRSSKFDLPASASNSWIVRVTRTTADSTTVNLQNDLWVDSYTDIINAKLSYPNSALVGIQINSIYFSQVPQRFYLVHGLYIKVPSNYDAATRTYTGVWNGTYKLALSNNPAWVLYDLLTNNRYGLGQYINYTQIDMAALYAIGQYCDGMVPDGFGGTEPRFTINTAIQTQTEAYKLLSDLTSVFRGMAFWNGSMVGITQDAPTDPSMIYSQSNVIDGLFTYTSSARRDRHSVALVTWNDPTQNYRQVVEYVEDPQLIAQFGIRKTEVIAFGCTSRGQAHRVGKWLLYTERYESNMINFKVGIDSMLVTPGEVIQIQDASRAGKRISGRLLSGSTTTSLPLDDTINVVSGSTVTVILPDGTIGTSSIVGSGNMSVLSLGAALTAAPLANSLWMITEPALAPLTARVVGIAQGDTPTEFAITAITHDPNKYTAIEQNYTLDSVPTSIIAETPAPTGVVVNDYAYNITPTTVGVRMDIAWVSDAPGFILNWRRTDIVSNWESKPLTTPSISIDNASGTYQFSLVAVGATGIQSPIVSFNHTVASAAAAPSASVTVSLDGAWTAQDCNIKWTAAALVTDYDVEVWNGAGTTLRRTERISGGYAYSYSFAKNVNDGVTRSLIFKVYPISATNGLRAATPGTLAATNPQVAAPTGMSVSGGVGQVVLKADTPTDSDYAGTIIWAKATALTGADLIPANQVYDGPTPNYTYILAGGSTMHFVMAHYDKLGKDSLNASTDASGTSTIAGGVPTVSAQPGTTYLGDDVVYYGAGATPDFKLYRWNSTLATPAYIKVADGGDLTAGSVTADKITVANLAAISANMGAISAGNITLNAAGFIQGGATGYLTGTGYYMGWSAADSKYKFHVGNPAGNYMAWDGGDIQIKGTQFSLLNGVATFSGSLNVKSAASGARLEIVNDSIKVYDASGVLRVQIGNLA